MVDFVSAIQSLTTGTEIVKAIRTAEKSYDQAVLRNELAEVLGALADAKMALIDARDEVSHLKTQLKQRGALIYEEPVYYLEQNDQRDGPYCQRCHDVDGKLVRVLKRRNNDAYNCEGCGKYFYGPNYKTPPTQRTTGLY